MVFDAKILTALIFIILNIGAIFMVKNRTNILTVLITLHLVMVLFFSLTITNYNSFKEIVLTVIAYLMFTIFLISSSSEFSEGDFLKKKISAKKNNISILNLTFCAVIFLVLFFALFSITKSSISYMDKARSAVIDNTVLAGEKIMDINDRKKMRLQKKLSENSLLKHSSDVILIIVAATSGMLFLRRKET